MTSSMTAHTQLLHSLFEAALSATQPGHCVPKHMPPPSAGRTIVIGAGRAATGMAQALERHWPDASLSGLIICPADNYLACEAIDVLALNTPYPDAKSVAASEALLARVQHLNFDDQVIILLSPDGAHMLTLPLSDTPVDELNRIERALLERGASARERLIVLKHLSATQGGRLAAACAPAQVHCLVMSNSPEEELGGVESGPTVADVSTQADAQAILASYDIALSNPILTQLQCPDYETIKPHDPALARCTTQLIATPQQALEAAAKRAYELGIKSLILSDSLVGEAKDIGVMMASIARQIRTFDQPISPPCILLSGGHSTVSELSHTATGPNVEFLLSLALSLQGYRGISAIACDSKGSDGTAGCAGAIVTELSLTEALSKGINAAQHLACHDTHAFFSAIGQAVFTGPTQTDLNDFRAIFIDER